MHPRNIHRNGYDFSLLTNTYPSLNAFITQSTKGKPSIDFANPDAVKCLNAALINTHYKTPFWDIPKGFLCPAVPGRADYIHHIADLLAADNSNEAPTGKNIQGLDIGTGANLIYPIIGSQTYGWKFVACDAEQTSFQSAKTIAHANSHLKKRVKVRQQNHKKHYFKSIIQADEYFDFTMCNPPFHSSPEAAQQGNTRKLKGLQHNQNKASNAGKTQHKSFKQIDAKPTLNFGGQSNELWCDGGELTFIQNMVAESTEFAKQVGWFTCLVSKSAHLPMIKQTLKQFAVTRMSQVDMAQGNKMSRFIAWSFQ